MELPKRYDPQEAEPRISKFWLDNETYKFDSKNTEKKIFSIDTPPPTVSGKMHMGHAFGNSQQDFIARFKRMSGYNVLQPFGTDDNGLPTQLLIQKTKRVLANTIGRKEFRDLCLKTLDEELKPKYLDDWKRIGISCDFNVSYSTIDPHSQKVSQKSFLDLYKSGREYRIEAPAMFCPKCRTAISQVECEDHELESFFNDIVFKVDGEDLVVATTRPELLPACVSIFYHPDDDRFKKLEGKTAKVPLFDFEVPIIPDSRADPEKGTGIVMCCTFGDQTDMEWQKAHQLPIKMAIGRDGKMTEIASKYSGMKIKDARSAIIEDLKEAKLLVNQKPIKHAVNVHERCGTEIEFVHSKQWFVKYLDIKEDMLKWGDEFKWFPAHMKNRYTNWVNGLAWDWCISRQISFGIPFPVWYCEDCDEVIVAKEKDLPVDPMVDKAPLDKCPKCSSSKIIGEKDIINTWATSSLTPTIVKELFKGEPVYDYLINNPMDLRPQGHDIISFWLFNTVVKSQLHYKMKPWNDAFINGWMLDPKGKKMSKSKGNVIEPQATIDKFSADALRYMAGSCSLGEDLPFPEKDVVTGQKFVNKMWNASKFVFMHLDDFDGSCPSVFNPIDKWVLSKLNQTVKACSENFEVYRFSQSKRNAEKFFWQVFCDNYLEFVKDRVYNSEKYSSEEVLSAKYTLYHSLFAVTKLMAPITPFITEEVYQLFFKEREKDSSIHNSSWPYLDDSLIDSEIDKMGDLMVDVVSAVRKYKSQNGLSLKTEIEVLTIHSEDNNLIDLIKTVEKDILSVCNASVINYSDDVDLDCENYPVKIKIQMKESEK